MSDVYDDPAFQQGTRVKFDQVGDRVRGVVITVEKTSFGSDSVLKYRLGEVALRQAGHQFKLDQTELLASQTQLIGQLVMKRPRPGDLLDIQLTELKPSSYGNPAKLFTVNVTPFDQQAQAAPAPQPPPQPYPPQPAPQYPPPQQPAPYPPAAGYPPQGPQGPTGYPPPQPAPVPQNVEEDLFG